MFDNNLPPRLAKALQVLFQGDHIVLAVREKFPASTKDIDLIRSLSQDGGWVFVSGDRRITKIKAEREAFRNSKLTGFFLSQGLNKASLVKKAERLLVLWATIETTVKTIQPGAMFELQGSHWLMRGRAGAKVPEFCRGSDRRGDLPRKSVRLSGRGSSLCKPRRPALCA